MNWARFSRKVVDYLWLVRIVSSLFLAGLVLATARFFEQDGTSALASSAAVFFVSAGGFAANDIADVQRDLVNTPTRPLPSGRLTGREAVVVAVVCYATAFLISARWLNASQMFIVCVYIVSLTFYSKLSDMVPLYKNVYVAAIIASFALVGISAEKYTACEFAFAAVIFLFVLSGEISGDLYDRDGDRRTSRLTIPVLWGERSARNTIVIANLLVVGGLWKVTRYCHRSIFLVVFGIGTAFLNSAVAGLVVSGRMSSGRFRVSLEIEKHALAVTVASFFLNA